MPRRLKATLTSSALLDEQFEFNLKLVAWRNMSVWLLILFLADSNENWP